MGIKKLLSVILAFVMILSLLACGKQEAAAPGTDEVTVTDLIGRKVSVVPGSYKRVVCIGAGALRMYCYIGDVQLLVGVEDDRFQAAMDLIEKVCKSRKQITPSPSSMVGMPGSYAPYPIEVIVGGATVFVLTVDQFVKL